MLQGPSLVIESFGGFGTADGPWVFFLDGFDQYFSKMHSFSHFDLERCKAAAATALKRKAFHY